jgi:hypothetical protein
MVYDATRVGQNCEFCGSPALVAYEDIKSPIRPEGVLPFCIDRNRVRDDIRRWWRSKWLAPGRLAKAALVDTVKSLYIPYWTFDAERALPVGRGGRLLLLRQRRRPRQQGQSRRPAGAARAMGARVRACSITRFDDELVPGTTGVDLNLLLRSSPFRRREIVPYDTAFLSVTSSSTTRVALTEAAGDPKRRCARRSSSSARRQVPATRIAIS